jgi:hypothetical protein
MGGSNIGLAPITADDVPRVAEFLHAELNREVAATAWTRLLTPPWARPDTDSGFMLLSDGQVVGAYVTVKSHRDIGPESLDVCNLAAFCVTEDFRAQSLRLLRAVLAQKGFEFTDLSPSGNVVALNERLGFTRLDTATRLVANLPGPGRRDVTVSADRRRLEAVLGESDLRIYHDHRDAAAARHLLVETPRGHAYLVFRRDRRKHLPLFASPLYVGGDRECLARAWPVVRTHLLRQHGLPFTLAERRILGFEPGVGVPLGTPRPKMVRGQRLDPGLVDYLYSELVLLEW